MYAIGTEIREVFSTEYVQEEKKDDSAQLSIPLVQLTLNPLPNSSSNIDQLNSLLEKIDVINPEEIIEFVRETEPLKNTSNYHKVAKVMTGGLLKIKLHRKGTTSHKFIILSELGKGHESKYFEAIDCEEKKEVAYGRRILTDQTEAENEINILKMVKGVEEFIQLQNVFYYKDQKDRYKQVKIFDLCLGNLKSYFVRTPFKIDQVNFCLDIIKGLAFLHEKNVVHGDIKPSNILIKYSDIKKRYSAVLADLEMAHTIGTKSIGRSRPYFAPEGWDKFAKIKETEKVDIWACGLVFLEIGQFKMPEWHLTLRKYAKEITSEQKKACFAEMSIFRPLASDINPFQKLFYQMINPDPDQRPSALKVEREIIEIKKSKVHE